MRPPCSRARSRRRRRKGATPASFPPSSPTLRQARAQCRARAPTPKPPLALEGSLVVLAKLKELEFHSRATLERLAELALTVESELKQKEIVGPLDEVYSAQSAFQTKLTTLIETYKGECDRMERESGV